MTTWYKRVVSVYGSPSRADFVSTGTGYAGVVEFSLQGGGHHAAVIMRYDSPANGFNPVTNGVIDGWARADSANVASLSSSDFDLIVLTLKPAQTPGTGSEAYDVLEIAVGGQEVNGKTVLVGTAQSGPRVVVHNMVNDATRLTLP